MRLALALGAMAIAAMLLLWTTEVPARNSFWSGSRATREDSPPPRSAPETFSDGEIGSDAPPPVKIKRPLSWTGMARRFLVGGFFGKLLLGRMPGGFGLLDLLVLTGLILLAFRALSGSRETVAESYAGFFGGAPSTIPARPPAGEPQGEPAGALQRAVAEIRDTDPSFEPARFAEVVSDTFCRVQAAWTAGDMRQAADLLTVELREQLQRECERLRSSGRINRVERIRLHHAAISDARRERGWDQVTVHIIATLVDYTTDESGRKVLGGNPFEPVPFQERWDFIRPTGSTLWRVSAMH